MKFYDREEEIRELRAIRERSRETAQWTVVTGRRRVGKTALVQEALEKLCKGRTTIIIAHRLSTVKHADVIYCLRDGKVVEHGSHAELLARDGYYKMLYDMHTF